MIHMEYYLVVSTIMMFAGYSMGSLPAVIRWLS